MIVFISIYTYFSLINPFRFKLKNKVSQAKKITTFNKKNLNSWMNLTKKERYKIAKNESITYFNKRKVLLEEIRKEYKKISKGKSK